MRHFGLDEIKITIMLVLSRFTRETREDLIKSFEYNGADTGMALRAIDELIEAGDIEVLTRETNVQGMRRLKEIGLSTTTCGHERWKSRVEEWNERLKAKHMIDLLFDDPWFAEQVLGEFLHDKFKQMVGGENDVCNSDGVDWDSSSN